MQTPRCNIRECSVRLWRCDGDGRGSAVTEPRGPNSPGAPRASNHFQEYCEVPVVFIKTEHNEEAITTQGTGAAGHAVADVGLRVKEEHDSTLRIKDEPYEVSIKQELEFGPTLLQPQTTPPRSLPPPNEIVSDENPSTSSWYRLLPLPCTAAAETEAKDQYCKEDFKTSCDDDFVFEMKMTDNDLENVSREQYYGLLSTQEGTRPVYGPPTENTHITYGLRTKADKDSSGQLHECDYCKYSTKKKSNLIIHVRTHTGEKPYKCDQCEYRAAQISTLKTHTRIHTGERPYKCDRCEYSTSRVNSLTKHMRTHTGEKPYKCDRCEYSASQRGNLITHMSIHTGIKPYKCEHCEYRSSNSYNLKLHVRSHTGKKPFNCEHCDYSTYRLSRLKIHMRTHTGRKLQL